MKKLALGLASAGAFATLTLGLAGPATAAPAYVQPVDCHVHVNSGGNDVDVSWC